MIETIGYIAAAIGTICWIPQVFKVWQTKQTKDLSLFTNLLILITMTLWLVYGIALGSLPLIIANVFSILFVGSIVSAKLIYK